MNILFTCGGTAGHVNPAVALARIFQERNPGLPGALRGGGRGDGDPSGAQGGLSH